MRDEEQALCNELERALDGRSLIEKALLIAGALREVYGGEWSIEAKADGGFSITNHSQTREKPTK